MHTKVSLKIEPVFWYRRCLEPGFSGLKGFTGFWFGGILLFWVYLARFFCTHYFLDKTDKLPCYFGCTRCLELGFSGLERIYRISLRLCTAILHTKVSLKIEPAISDVHAVLNQDFQDWKGFTGFLSDYILSRDC